MHLCLRPLLTSSNGLSINKTIQYLQDLTHLKIKLNKITHIAVKENQKVVSI